jgi:uncharacterized protein (DUF58 family)
MTLAPGARFLDPRVLARIDDLELIARTVVEGFLSGLHRSPYLGRSVDFAEHRPYMPGDDIRRIDWRLFARTDRFYVKEFEADSSADFVQLLDVSRSMRFSSHEITKLDYARRLAACLAYFAHKQRDRVGLATFDRELVDFIPPSVRHLSFVLHALDRVGEGRAGAIRPPLLKAAELFRRRGLVAVISDLYEEPDVVREAVLGLQGRGSDLIVFHVLDPAEIQFPYDRACSFEDVETGQRMPVVPEYVREQYRSLVAEHVARLGRELGEGRVDYALLDTSLPLDQALFAFLSRRERLVRTR